MRNFHVRCYCTDTYSRRPLTNDEVQKWIQFFCDLRAGVSSFVNDFTVCMLCTTCFKLNDHLEVKKLERQTFPLHANFNYTRWTDLSLHKFTFKQWQPIQVTSPSHIQMNAACWPINGAQEKCTFENRRRGKNANQSQFDDYFGHERLVCMLLVLESKRVC